ncbi:hypothetical protein MMC07_006697 [Pseudocyphellaria aurata]|nr:hypothetical protein [Pseudocyphellaria aurata]
MSSKTSEPSMGTDAAAKYLASDIPKIPLGPSRRQKRGPPGRETTHPIPQLGMPQASRKRGPEERETTHPISQAVQTTLLSGQRAQGASEKLASNFIDCMVPLQSSLNPVNGSSGNTISTKLAPKSVSPTTENALPKA